MGIDVPSSIENLRRCPRLPLAKILVATDFSPASDCSLHYAVALARHYQSHLYIVHVVLTENAPLGSGAYRSLRHCAEQKLAAVVDSGCLAGVSHEALLEPGYLWDTLDAMIRERGISLAVVGTHGARHSDQERMGSAAELIFRHADCPVLTVGPVVKHGALCDGQIKTILFATDFGRAAQHVAPFAFSLARDFHATLALLHVLAGEQNYAGHGLAMLRETTRIHLLESVPAGMHEWCHNELLIRSGDSAAEILAAADSVSADLIVLGAKSGRNLATHLPQTTAYTVASAASCPILTFRA